MVAMSDYELLRLERIKRNAERLKALGLDKNPLQRKKKISPRKKKTVSKIKPGQERRSRRLSFNNKKNDVDLVMLDYSAEDGEVKAARQHSADDDYYDEDSDGDDDDESDNATGGHQKFRSRKVRIDMDEWKLSEKDRESLAAGSVDDNFLAKFQEFLEYHNRISEQNVRSVMRQARKLASGNGIRYESPRYGWPEDCVFKKGVKITPMSDFVELMIEGQACEDKWGRDHGNGWLISHPLKKLLLFQQFILNNPDFLNSKLRLKDYCGGY